MTQTQDSDFFFMQNMSYTNMRRDEEIDFMNHEYETAQIDQYDRIANAIRYIHQHFQEQPSLEQIASAVHVRSYSFSKTI